MEVIYGLNKIKKYKRPVVALGVFDGVHRGHRSVLKAVVRKAKRIKGTSEVVTFWPDPHREKSLYSLEHRLRLMGSIGIEVCIVIKFNKKFSGMSAGNFIKNILVNKVGIRYLYVGRNFRFGKGAQGNFKILEKLSRIYNFKVRAFEIIKMDSQPISSTYIRRLITKGRLNIAQKLLSRLVSVLGTVIRGSSLGRKLGFPTANINPHHEVLPPCGVYVISAIFNNKKFKGVCYIGTKPTFKNSEPRIKNQETNNIEVYIFNFNKNIYGKYLEIQFLKKLRNERKFSSKEVLVKQVKKDIHLAKRILSLHS